MSSLPAAESSQNYVTIHALSSGYLTLPEHLFVKPAVEGKRNTVPSLSFLIQHHEAGSGKLTRVVFDMGLRRDLNKYPKPLRDHLVTREPIETEPDVAQSLALGGLSPKDIDVVILSHVHWDHIGTPTDFPTSQFIVGNGSLHLLRSGADPSKTGSHAYYEPDLLPLERTTELAAAEEETKTNGTNGTHEKGALGKSRWQKLGLVPSAMDLFGDGSVYLVDAPGHLEGHLNLLVRTGAGKWIYLAGDACHDRRLLSKELEIGTWTSAHGDICCIHVDKAQAEATIDRIAALENLQDQHVEVILAHDIDWLSMPSNKKRFWPGSL